MPPVTRTHKRIGEKGSDEGEAEEHPSSPTKLMKSPSQTPFKKRKAGKTAAKLVKKRNVRGPTYMPKVVRRMQVQRSVIRYNKRGQLIGKNASEMQSYIGMVARQTVPLSICSRPKVSAVLKNKIWEQVRVISFSFTWILCSLFY